MTKLLFTSVVFTWSIFAAAASNSDDLKDAKVVEAHFPKDLSVLKDDNSGATLTLENGLGYAFEKVDFDGKGKAPYLVVIYQAAKSPSNIVCKFVVIKTETKNNGVVPDIVLNDTSKLGNCSNIEVKDLDGDNKPEVLVQSSNVRGKLLAPYIFSWAGDKLVDITPTTIIGGKTVSAFRETSITDVKIGKSILIVDEPFESHDETGKFVTYLLEKNKINPTGDYDFFAILGSKHKKKTVPIVLKPSLADEGAYTLDIKNLSAHTRAVRAEVTVNGAIILKPQDFCSAPPNKKNKDNEHDDDDDLDEDKCKRCSPKNSAYAIVNLDTSTEIKVKVYGRGDSKLQLSLVKK